MIIDDLTIMTYQEIYDLLDEDKEDLEEFFKY